MKMLPLARMPLPGVRLWPGLVLLLPPCTLLIGSPAIESKPFWKACTKSPFCATIDTWPAVIDPPGLVPGTAGSTKISPAALVTVTEPLGLLIWLVMWISGAGAGICSAVVGAVLENCAGS